MAASATLDPVGRFRLPRRPATLRAAAVAALLLTAVGLLYTDPRAGPPAGQPATAASPGTGDHPGPSPDAGPGTDSGPVPGTGLAIPEPAGPGPEPGTERLAIPPGRVGVPVGLGDPARLALLRPGDRVDLLAVPVMGGDPVPLASEVPVLAVDPAAGTLLLAVTPEQGRAVLSAPGATTTFAVLVHG
jgi:hypothetical protein